MINKNGPNELECVETNFHKDMIKTDKLIIKSSGDWDIRVSMISCHYFSSRKEFDDLILGRRSKYNSGNNFETISIKEAFKQLNTKIKVNMDYFFCVENKKEFIRFVGGDYDFEYYQWIWNEMKKMKAKMNSKKLDASEQYCNHKMQMKNIKSILLLKLIMELFGENVESVKHESIYNLKDFQVLYHDGNFTCASACNGENYLGFDYGTS
uniref:Uncharacterized protein n=1 Tax=Panagrolaimus sp. ES5 TaxID=591445 RepID=A0AC34GRL8_9BILA